MNASHFRPRDLRQSAVIAKAIALNVPVVMENYNQEHLRAITGLGIHPKSRAVMIQSDPGNRAFTISLLNAPRAARLPPLWQMLSIALSLNLPGSATSRLLTSKHTR